MALVVRDVQAHELDSILALNNGAGPSVTPLDMPALSALYTQACHFKLAELDGQIAGFLLALRETDDRANPHIAALRAQFPAFVFIDRVVVAPPYQRHGLGRVFYAAATSYAEARVPVLTCEVQLEPRNDIALLFHGSWGFQEVVQRAPIEAAGDVAGRTTSAGRVALLAKSLDCYAFIRDTYLEGDAGRLPDLPWLAERHVLLPEPLRGTGT